LVLPDRRVSENQELVIVFKVKNYWPLPVFGMMVKGDFLQALDVDEEPIAFSLKRVAAWSDSEFRIPIKPRRRGRLPTGKVHVTNGFPFGLIDVSKEVIHSESVLVWPSCETLEGFPVSESTRFSLQGALKDRSGNDGDSIGVRCYRDGDRLQNIHWAQTVRSQRLMVRERQTIASTGATILLDLSPANHVGHGVDNSLEWAIRIAASICSHLHETQSPVRIVCLGLPNLNQVTVNNQTGLRAVMDFLADLPTLEEALVLSKKSLSPACQARHSLAGSERVFLVGTNRSNLAQTIRMPNVTPIVIDFAGFATEGQAIPNQDIEVCGECENAIFIANPESAASQLTSNWNRSFSDAV
jgi:uncharacterized protein (DUF58 family)